MPSARPTAPHVDPRPRPDPELGATARAVELAAGHVGPEQLGIARSAGALFLVCDGLLLAHVELRGARASDILGPGDLVRLGSGSDDLLRAQWSLEIVGHARVAVLDGQLHEIVRRSPQVAERLLRCAGERSRRQLLHRVAVQKPRVETRLMGVLWLMAERWGTLTPRGVALPFRPTHALLGQLIGAKRPTVTTAISMLCESGSLVRSGRDLLLGPASRHDWSAARPPAAAG